MVDYPDDNKAEPPERNDDSNASESDAKLLREIRDKFRTYAQFWADNYKEGDQDMQCLSAEYGPWPQDEITRRKAAGRPICHVDIITQYIRRIENQARLNPRGIVVEPQGSEASDETASMREDRIRQIDYADNAKYVRLHAEACAISRGLGFYMVTTDWARHDDFEQRICTRHIPNPKSVLFDPFAKNLDFSDMKGAFILDRYEWGQYRSQFHGARVRSFADEYLSVAPGWIDDKSVQVAEYWCVKTKARKLLKVETEEGPTTVFVDDLEGAKLEKNTLVWGDRRYKVLKQRDTEAPTVWQYITNGLEILKRKRWVGSTIPLVVVTGLRKYENGKLVIESATRKMRAGQLLYDYAWTNIQETFGLLPKPKYLAVIGQTEELPEWDDAHRDPTAVLRYRAITEETGATVLPPPQFEHAVPNIGPFIVAINEAARAVQQAAGMFSVERKDRVAKSGIAIHALNQEQDIGNYHFADFLDLAIQYEGQIKNEILRHVEDTQAVRGFRAEDDTYERKEVVPKADPESGDLVEHPYGKGRDHDVIVKAGPAMSSQWEKAGEFLDILAQHPQFAPVVMDLVIHMKQLGPLGKKMAERFEKMLPPMVREPKEGEPAPPPPEMVQKLQQMDQMIAGLTEQLNTATEQIKAEQFKLQAQRELKELELATQERIEGLKVDAKIAEIAAKIDIEEFRSRMEMIKAELAAVRQPGPVEGNATAQSV